MVHVFLSFGSVMEKKSALMALMNGSNFVVGFRFVPIAFFYKNYNLFQRKRRDAIWISIDVRMMEHVSLTLGFVMIILIVMMDLMRLSAVSDIN